ncbi:MAG: hypothetical protein NVS1B11_23870 [Terriglobales bacterium]
MQYRNRSANNGTDISTAIVSCFGKCQQSFGVLTPNDWILIVDKAEQLSFKKGDKLLEEGKTAKTVYLMLKGMAVIRTNSKARVAKIGPGEICEEMAYLESAQASATVVAEEDLEAYAISWTVLDSLFELYPHLASRFYLSLALNLSRRLRKQISSSLLGSR